MTSKTSRGRLLIVDDDPGVLEFLGDALRQHGYEAQTASCGTSAAKLVKEQTYDVIISDLAMPGMDGISFLRVVRGHDLDVPVLLITGSPSLETAIQAIEYGAFRYLVKPLNLKTLQDNVDYACRLSRIARAKREAMELLGVEERLTGDRAGLEASFEQAVEALWIAFQPIVIWSGRRVFGYEALVRTDQPTMKNPAELLDAAERLGRVHELGHAIRSRIVEETREIDAGLKIFVNLHPIDLKDETLFDRDSEFARMADRVVLEITERASLDQVSNVRGRIDQLKSMGFSIAIDDLGAGYAGLTSFTQLEPQVVKLDMTLIRNLHAVPTKIRLVSSIVDVCRGLGIQVVAEGIECTEERDALAELGCDLLQGYLFARPERGFPEPRI